MSELKPYIGPHPTDATLTEYYLKSEADKVIAELKSDIADLRDDKKSTDSILVERNTEIAELKADYDEVRGRLQTANLIKDEQLAATRHQKYKRCLAMASNCRLRARWFGDNAFYKKEQWALQWHRRWLELAEKLKDE